MMTNLRKLTAMLLMGLTLSAVAAGCKSTGGFKAEPVNTAKPATPLPDTADKDPFFDLFDGK